MFHPLEPHNNDALQIRCGCRGTSGPTLWDGIRSLPFSAPSPPTSAFVNAGLPLAVAQALHGNQGCFCQNVFFFHVAFLRVHVAFPACRGSPPPSRFLATLSPSGPVHPLLPYAFILQLWRKCPGNTFQGSGQAPFMHPFAKPKPKTTALPPETGGHHSVALDWGLLRPQAGLLFNAKDHPGGGPRQALFCRQTYFELAFSKNLRHVEALFSRLFKAV